MLKTIKIKLQKLRRSKSNVNMVITVIAVVMIWRGVRGFLDTFLFPHYHILSYTISVTIGIVILLLDNWKLDELSHH